MNGSKSAIVALLLIAIAAIALAAIALVAIAPRAASTATRSTFMEAPPQVAAILQTLYNKQICGGAPPVVAAPAPVPMQIINIPKTAWGNYVPLSDSNAGWM